MAARRQGTLRMCLLPMRGHTTQPVPAQLHATPLFYDAAPQLYTLSSSSSPAPTALRGRTSPPVAGARLT